MNIAVIKFLIFSDRVVHRNFSFKHVYTCQHSKGDEGQIKLVPIQYRYIGTSIFRYCTIHRNIDFSILCDVSEFRYSDIIRYIGISFFRYHTIYRKFDKSILYDTLEYRFFDIIRCIGSPIFRHNIQTVDATSKKQKATGWLVVEGC